MKLPPEKRWWRQEYADHPDVWPIYEDFKVFLRLVWDHLGLPPPTPVQLAIADFLQHGPRRRVIEAFRGVGKSYITSALVCWLLLRDPDVSVLVVSASKERSDSFSTFVLRLISEMDILRYLMPKDDQRSAKIAFDVGPAKAKHAPSVKSVGITGQLTGSRANIIVADDIETPKNSETQPQREKLAELVKEFDAVLVPGGEIVYLGTPQTEQSLYNRLPERGYEIRVWPAEVPDAKYIERQGSRLAPSVLRMIEQGAPVAASVDPKRFSKEDLLERKLSYGPAGYALQFMMDTSLADVDRYPLKLRNLMVLPLDAKKAPVSVVWGPKPENARSDLEAPGLDGDGLYRPAFVDDQYQPYTGAVMFVDPSGRGKDETAWAISKHLNGTVFLTLAKGKQGGYEDDILREIAQDARDQVVNTILVEENFGQGMFAKLLQPHLLAVGHPCEVLEKRNTRQKELRILDTLEPLLGQHRLVVGEDVIQHDAESVQGYPGDEQTRYRLFYQMTRISRDKGSLIQDDRLDAVAGSVAYWVDAMSLDQAKTAQKAKEKLLKKDLMAHFKNQVFSDPRVVGPHRGPSDRHRPRGNSFRLPRR